MKTCCTWEATPRAEKQIVWPPTSSGQSAFFSYRSRLPQQDGARAPATARCPVKESGTQRDHPQEGGQGGSKSPACHAAVSRATPGGEPSRRQVFAQERQAGTQECAVPACGTTCAPMLPSALRTATLTVGLLTKSPKPKPAPSAPNSPHTQFGGRDGRIWK